MECCICFEQATHEMKCSTCMSGIVCHKCFLSIETDTSEEYIYGEKRCPICRTAYIPHKVSSIFNHFLHLNQGVSSHTNKITKIVRREQCNILDNLNQELNGSNPISFNKIIEYNNLILGYPGNFFLSPYLLNRIDKHIGECIYPSERNNCFRKNRIHIIAGFKKVTFQKGNKELITLRDIMNFLNRKAFLHHMWDCYIAMYGEDYIGEEDYIYRIYKSHRRANTIYLEIGALSSIESEEDS